MSLSAREAAEAVGMTKDGILKAIRSGKISAEKHVNGEWRIEPVELFRVYAPVSSSPQTNGAGVHPTVFTPPQPSAEPSVESLQAQLRQIEQRLVDKDEVLRAASDALRAANDQILDLRRRLDAESEERRRLTAVLEAMAPPKAKVGWWQRLLGGGD